MKSLVKPFTITALTAAMFTTSAMAGFHTPPPRIRNQVPVDLTMQARRPIKYVCETLLNRCLANTDGSDTETHICYHVHEDCVKVLGQQIKLGRITKGPNSPDE